MEEKILTSGIERLETLQVGLLATNCYVLRVASGEVAVVDPGGDAEAILSAVGSMAGSVAYILCTHGHIDHIEAASEVRASAGGAVVLHRADVPLWEGIAAQAALFQLPPPSPAPPPDLILEAEATISLGSVEIQVIPVPGHSPGSVLFLLLREGICFNGDTVFAAGIGRTDLWGGSSAELRASIAEKIFSLPEGLVLYPGHGPPVSVREARRNEVWLDILT